MAISTAVDLSAVARVVGIATKFRDLRGGSILFLPQRVAIIGQGSMGAQFAPTKRQVTTALEAATLYGHGSPIHLAALQLLPVNGDGVGTIPVTVYPLADATTSTPAKGLYVLTGQQTETAAYFVRVGGVQSLGFTLTPTDTVTIGASKIAAAINAVLAMPVTAVAAAGVVTMTAKWKGASGNDIKHEIIGSFTSGTTFALSAFTGGLVNPDVQPALDQVGDVWETMLLNTLNIDDVAALNKFEAFGAGRWGALTRKPCIVFTGNTVADVTAATAVADSRKLDRVNAQLVAPGSSELPTTIAARQLARIASVANNNPARDYGSQPVTGVVPGADSTQWLYNQRDVAVKRGSSTVEIKDGVLHLSDTVTFYHPSGDPIPAYRYVADIVKLQNIIFNMDLVFAVPEWDGAPLIPDDQPTVNRDAKKPKMAIAEVAAVLDSLGHNALISDPETSKKATQAAISDQNPKRLDLLTTVQLSGNSNIISMDLNFGFLFGTQTVIN